MLLFDRKTAKSRKKVNSRPNVNVPEISGMLVHQKKDEQPNIMNVEAKLKRKKVNNFEFQSQHPA